jgi:predicted XRE-type DNA-binding protein
MSASAKKSIRKMAGRKLPAFEVGGGNVFEDLGFPNADMELVKATLAAAILTRMNVLGLTQAQAAARLGIHQPRVSMIKCGRLCEFSIGTLLELALKLGIDVDINVRQEQNAKAAGRMSLRGEPVAGVPVLE